MGGAYPVEGQSTQPGCGKFCEEARPEDTAARTRAVAHRGIRAPVGP